MTRGKTPKAAIATEIEMNGGSIRRVVLDYELKEQLYRDQNNASAQDSEQHRTQVAAKHGLTLVGGSIPFPTSESSSRMMPRKLSELT